ncbi:UDP-N-acetylglucosamine 2-epimerase [Clostridium weizhouense]|uniref:UDP-N-acetylglucosamine 2-epimerase (Hydrolyzing) n=1 Tax=Clostridium weizhouense TaxID=2859781 RepID=A0ABS7APQ5_9CLOT|nr:UDP-N-acetylglucosamine 2-epimerase [Clostridium weizhouense]MBW6410609.1 UDP-N-acetylglucosamine 2-epimerase (hydrolyzing) [Clostridium weizhouense]
MKKILAITGIRSDYDLMSNLFKKINSDDYFELNLLVCGAHLSQTYGNTVKLIEKDGFKILIKIESLIDSDSKSSRLKTTSIILQNSIDIVNQYNPDLIIYAGDREEVLIGSMLGTFLKIPTAHFFGGDFTANGLVDNQIRNAASKMSSIHFVSTEEHKKRLVSIGEPEYRIFQIGSPALDKFKIEPIKDMSIIYKNLNIQPFDSYALVIYHPLGKNDDITFKNILKSIKEKKLKAFVSYPNTDAGNKDIINIINEYKDDTDFYFYRNLDRNTFINIYRNASFQIGNSSAGIVESASVGIPVINIGVRQQGRTINENVILVEDNFNDIKNSIDIVLDKNFIDKCKTIKNIYGDANSSEKAFKLLKNLNYKDFLLKLEDPTQLEVI